MIEVFGFAEIVLTSSISEINLNRDEIGFKIEVDKKLAGNYYLRIKYLIHIKEVPELKQLDDYVALVKGQLEKKIPAKVTLINHGPIKRVEDRIKHITEL